MNITKRMKSECIGEFSWEEKVTVWDSYGHEYEPEQTRTVPWNLCKDIYKAMCKIAEEEKLKQ